MGDLTQSRIGSVQRLLEQAPDAAVRTLQDLLCRDEDSDDANTAIRALIEAESAERRLRSTVFAPLGPLFRPPARIARLSFPARTPEVLWHALKRQVPEAVTQALEEARTSAGKRQDPFDRLCGEAARIVREAADAEVLQLVADLGDDGRADKLVMLLALAPLLRLAVAHLPEWLLNAGSEQDSAIRLAYKDAAVAGEAGGSLLVETLFAHLEESPQILRLISAIMDRPTDRYVAASELAGFGERLLDDVDARVEAVRRFDPRRGLEAGVAVASAADTAVAAMIEFEQHISLAREGVWGARIGSQRRSLALVMEMRLREVEPAVAAALPMQTVRKGGGRLKAVPSLGSAPDSAAVQRSFALLALLEGCRGSSSTGGYGALRTKMVETLDAWLEAYTEDLLELLHKGGADPGRLRAFLDVAAEFTALVRDPEAAQIVRRRAAAA